MLSFTIFIRLHAKTILKLGLLQDSNSVALELALLACATSFFVVYIVLLVIHIFSK